MGTVTRAGLRTGFNEAAAFRRGNQFGAARTMRRSIGFNEAAAFRRGNHPFPWAANTAAYNCFNEAAAFRRGNLLRCSLSSMLP